MGFEPTDWRFAAPCFNHSARDGMLLHLMVLECEILLLLLFILLPLLGRVSGLVSSVLADGSLPPRISEGCFIFDLITFGGRSTDFLSFNNKMNTHTAAHLGLLFNFAACQLLDRHRPTRDLVNPVYQYI